MKKSIILLFLLPLGLAAQQQDSIAERFASLVTSQGMSRNLHVLASDEYEGRETGQRGQKMAACYIASCFKEAGIPPYRDTTYYQQFPLNLVLPAPAKISVNNKPFTGNKDYYNFPGIPEQQLSFKAVTMLGYGIDEPAYSDYKGQDVKGKVVMIFAGEPVRDSLSLISGKKQLSLWSTYYKVKLEKARESGIALLLVVVDDIEKSIRDNEHRIESPSLKIELDKTEMPIVYISREMAASIMGGKQVDDIRKKINASGRPQAKEFKMHLEITFSSEVQKIGSENVLAYIEGSDKKDELVIITAHYDHLGKDGNVVFNGADDDGSGTVAVIELAKAFAEAKKNGHGPRRSMLFMTVSGEEKGLLGSAWYTSHPVYPLASTVCDLNIDMIGRVDEQHRGNPNYIYLIGSDKLSTELHRISEEANKKYEGLMLDYTYNDEKDKNRYYYRSDHYNFAKNGVPVIFYFNGVHADYHKETDEVEKIDFNKMEKITRLVFYTAWEVANREQRIVVDSHKN